MEIVDRMLLRITFQMGDEWLECYLHESSLLDKPFVVVERTSAKSLRRTEYDCREEALAAYDVAAERTKAAVRLHVK
jgi:hypothetical protein